MAVFKFRLEKVVRVRHIMEEKTKQEWAIAEIKVREEQARLDLLKHQRKEVKQFGYTQSDLEIRAAMYGYLETLAQKIEEQKSRVKESKVTALKAKEIWLAARQEREKIMTLRDKQYTEHVKNELREEQKAIDDMHYGSK